MTISTEQYNEAAKHLIEAMEHEPINTQELVESVKRLREITDNISKGLKIKSPSPVHPLEVHSEEQVVAIFAGSKTWNAEAFVSIQEAMKAINKLFDLVAELHAQLNYWLPESLPNAACVDLSNEFRIMAFREADKTLIKAAPIAELKGKA